MAVGDISVFVAPSVVAVKAFWDRSGRLAGPVIREQLSRFAEALVDAHAADELSAAVLVRNWSDDGGDDLRSAGTLGLGHARSIVARDHGFTLDVLAMLKTSAHPHDAGVAAEVEHALAMD